MAEDLGQVIVGSGHCWVFLTNLNINPSYKPASPVLGIYPRQIKAYDLKNKWCFFFLIDSNFIHTYSETGNIPNVHRQGNRQAEGGTSL